MEIRPKGTSELDGRPTYSRVSSALTQAVLITNTDKGDQMLGSIQLNKRFGRNFTLSTSYAYQDANSAFDGSSSQAHSNFQFHHTRGDIFDPEVSRSAYETTHRFNAAASFSPSVAGAYILAKLSSLKKSVLNWIFTRPRSFAFSSSSDLLFVVDTLN